MNNNDNMMTCNNLQVGD